jgi:hypothetical protein
MAVSEYPILSSEPKSALRLKTGVWLFANDPDCEFNPDRPMHQWPKCANWLAVKDNMLVDGPDAGPKATPITLMIAEGNPPLLEVSSNEEDKSTLYAYFVIEPVASDPAGEAIEVSLSPVACGIEEDSDNLEPKIQRFPGMDADCHPENVGALRSAALAGSQRQKKSLWRWIRASKN